MKRILYITNSYPQSGSPEKGFIFDELCALLRSGFSVTLAPIHRITSVDSELPTAVHVTDIYSKTFSARGIFITLVRLLFICEFWKEIFRRPGILFHRRFLKESIRLSSSDHTFRKILEDYDLF
jgi:hypothetical protein